MYNTDFLILFPCVTSFGCILRGSLTSILECSTSLRLFLPLCLVVFSLLRDLIWCLLVLYWSFTDLVWSILPNIDFMLACCSRLDGISCLWSIMEILFISAISGKSEVFKRVCVLLRINVVKVNYVLTYLRCPHDCYFSYVDWFHSDY